MLPYRLFFRGFPRAKIGCCFVCLGKATYFSYFSHDFVVPHAELFFNNALFPSKERSYLTYSLNSPGVAARAESRLRSIILLISSCLSPSSVPLPFEAAALQFFEFLKPKLWYLQE